MNTTQKLHNVENGIHVNKQKPEGEFLRKALGENLFMKDSMIP